MYRIEGLLIAINRIPGIFFGETYLKRTDPDENLAEACLLDPWVPVKGALEVRQDKLVEYRRAHARGPCCRYCDVLQPTMPCSCRNPVEKFAITGRIRHPV